MSDTPQSAPSLSDAPRGAPDPGAESLSSAMRSAFNVLRLLMIVLLAAYFLSGLFRVGENEQGLIVRFGKLRINSNSEDASAVFPKGIYPSLPDPFDEKVLVQGSSQRLLIGTFSIPIKDKDRGKKLADIVAQPRPGQGLAPGVDGYMITADRSIAHGLWTVEYRITDAEDFVDNIGETPERFEPLLQRLTEDAVLRTVSGLSIETVTRTNQNESGVDFTRVVADRLSASLDKLHSGVTIINVIADTTHPAGVREAFTRVANARSDLKKVQQEAKQGRAELLNRTAGRRADVLLTLIDQYGAAQATGASNERLAQMLAEIDEELEQSEGEVAVRIQDARSQADDIREGIRQEYERFVELRNQYHKYPELMVAGCGATCGWKSSGIERTNFFTFRAPGRSRF